MRRPTLYLALGALAHFLVDAPCSGMKPIALAKYSKSWRRGTVRLTDSVSEAATIGLLESIQNTLGGQDRRLRTISGVSAADFETMAASANASGGTSSTGIGTVIEVALRRDT